MVEGSMDSAIRSCVVREVVEAVRSAAASRTEGGRGG